MHTLCHEQCSVFWLRPFKRWWAFFRKHRHVPPDRSNFSTNWRVFTNRGINIIQFSLPPSIITSFLHVCFQKWIYTVCFFNEGLRAVLRTTSLLHRDQLRRPLCTAQSRVTVQQLSIAPILLISFGCLNKQQLLPYHQNAVHNCFGNVGLYFR
jgi:hypothetical protein